MGSNERRPLPDDETYLSALEDIDAVEGVDATRFNLPAIGWGAFHPSVLEALIPPRRGPVQGPAAAVFATEPATREAWAPPRGDGAPAASLWLPAADDTPAAVATASPPVAASLSRAGRIMALGTTASRVTGMIRSLLLASALGLSTLGDCFNTANNIPGTIYLLIVGGAVSSVFVPQLVRAMRDDADGGRQFTDRLLTIALVVLGVLTAACMLLAPQIADVTAGAAPAADHALTVTLIRYCLPQILCYGVWVILGQILNARERYGPMMWTPVLANLVMIATLAALMALVGHARLTEQNITPGEVALLGLGTTLGIVLQTVTMVPYLRRAGVGFRPRFDWRGAGLRKSATLAKWTMGIVLLGQIGSLVATRIGDTMDERFRGQGVGYTAYMNAQNIWQLPFAVITVSVITALLPRMSRYAQTGDRAAVRTSVSYGLRVAAVAIVPCAFALLAFGPQIAAVLFGHGQSDAAMARNTGFMLMALAPGLIPFSAQFVMMRGFYAYEDTRTPFVITAWVTAANVAIGLLAYATLKTTPWVMVGLCVASTLTYTIGAIMTGRELRRRLRGVEGRRVARTHIKLGAASVAAALIGAPVAAAVSAQLAGTVGNATALLGGGVVFGVLFLVVSRKLRIEEVTSLARVIRTRLGY
ncbi:murein biosynthesis integral membrane protein MurJ [Actinocrinis puniceicyclus]|uniref:Murein biosynthesis integral membrane protein MurJ n=1 Tax=Actinocrinis puniceicyclus TaxID=977794 RepID=A0A8J7WMU7_9ACTN|nr:murein biosynthesis integral membrane protein MurJ [Actinocrinis puniceicyclus]MBS2964233.1 murein biosynthesis integral membrane protein MurJ [Actinocrinis puniceicyclus]